MSQNSLVIPTSGTLSGLAAVQAMNGALDSLNTLNSGATAPPSPEAGQFWHDTTNNLLKIRSLDNTAWIVVGALNETSHTFGASIYPTPALFGLLMSNDASSPASVLDIAPGAACDTTGTVFMRLATAIKKNVTGAWAAGTGNGSLDTGSWTASSLYHVHLIYDGATGAVDVLTSASYSNPSLPSGYTNFVPIGAILSSSTSQIVGFTQAGNEFLYSNAVQNLAGQSISSTAQMLTLTVPGGLKVRAKYRAVLELNTSSTPAIASVLFSSPDKADQAPTTDQSLGPCSLGAAAYGTNVVANGADLETRTNASGQIRYRSSTTYANSALYVHTYGFIYPRGLQ